MHLHVVYLNKILVRYKLYSCSFECNDDLGEEIISNTRPSSTNFKEFNACPCKQGIACDRKTFTIFLSHALQNRMSV